MKIKLFCFFIIILVFPTTFQGAKPKKEKITVAGLIKKVDRLYRSDSSKSLLKMKIETPNWSRTMKMEMWTKGMDYTLIRILSPKKDAGITTLRRKKEMWNFFPKITKVIKVPPSMMMSNWMGSDFTNDDLVRETSLLEEYDASFFTLPKDPTSKKYYLIRLIPKKQTASVWGKIEIKVRKKDLIPLEQNYFDEKGKMKRTMTLKKIKYFGKKKLPAIMELVPLSKKANKTTIEYISATFNYKLKKDAFSLRQLQKKK